MRVITGSARGRKLITLDGADVRPTTDRVKEAVFSIIQFDIEGRSVLDLFSGSGQLGIEALSRGAISATFVDLRRESLEVTAENLKTTGLSDKARIIRSDYASFLSSCREKFDIAFLDPPYSTGILQNAVTACAAVMKETGTVICEHPAGEQMPERAGGFAPVKTYRYGKIAVTVYRKTEA